MAGGWALTLVGVVLLVARGAGDLVGALVVALVGALGTRAVLRRVAEPQDFAFLVRLVLAGVLLRVGLALVVHYLLPVRFFAPDQFTFQDVGWRTLLYVKGVGSAPRQIRNSFEVGYFYWNTFLFAIFGFVPLVPKLLNCFFGVWASLVAYRIGGELAGEPGARNAAILTMFFPSLLLWSSQNLRDTPTLLVLTFLLWSSLRLRRKPSVRGLVSLGLALLVLALLRDYMAVMVVFALIGSFLISPARSLIANLVFALVLFGLAVLAYDQLGLGSRWIESASFSAISEQRQALATGGTAFEPEVDISTPIRGLQYFPIGVAFFLLSPFPWQIGSMLSVMTLPEMMVWYALLFFVVSGGWFLVRKRFHLVEPIVLFVILTGSIYALVEGNAGTAYRHRAQIVMFLLIFAGIGLELWRLRRSASRSKRRAAGA